MVSRDPTGLPEPRSLNAVRSLRLSRGAVAVLLMVAIAVAVAISAFGSHGASAPVGVVRTSTAPPAESTIYVHLLGAVAKPGLYQLPAGSRAVDAVAAAGGFADGADRESLNLARFLSDGEQVRVPLEGEEPEPGDGPVGTVAGKVNLNTADASTLETLPRVGPAMAARIIAWREENGRFASIEDLRSVSGIGDKTFEAMRDLVTV
jgi:competence protein ComEA